MCPLRFILIFLSASLAGYFAWRTAWRKEEGEKDEDQFESTTEDLPSENSLKHGCLQKISSRCMTGFWTLVDMASGRYLWQILAAQKAELQKTA